MWFLIVVEVLYLVVNFKEFICCPVPSTDIHSLIGVHGGRTDGLGAGDPYGRKFLGTAVVKWLKAGLSAMVQEVAAAQERGDIEDAKERMGTGHNLMALAQPYLLANPMPEGREPLCLKASLHYPTVLDHYQRELRAALQASQVLCLPR